MQDCPSPWEGQSLVLYLTRSTVDAGWDVIKPWLEFRVQARFLSFVTHRPRNITLRTTKISRAAREPLRTRSLTQKGDPAQGKARACRRWSVE